MKRSAAHMIAVLKRLRRVSALPAIIQEWADGFMAPPDASRHLPLMLLKIGGFVCSDCGDAYWGTPDFFRSGAHGCVALCRPCGQAAVLKQSPK